MSMRVRAILWISLCLFPGTALAQDRLSRIFDPEMLNAQIAYLETITGPAMHVYKGPGGIEIRDYRVDGCRVEAYTKGAEAIGYSLVLNENCNFDLGKFIGPPYSSTRNLTIGSFVHNGFGAEMRAQSLCIYLCGNAADPTIDFTFEGPHALNFVKVVLTVELSDDPSLDAVERWRNAMRQREGEDYIIDTRFNCTPKYDRIAVQDFADVAVRKVSIGYNPNEFRYDRDCKPT
jgi:hypothetical protein